MEKNCLKSKASENVNSTSDGIKRFLVYKEKDGNIYGSKNKYLVLNTDEPYAPQVFELIKKHEKEKGTWDAPDNFEEFVKKI